MLRSHSCWRKLPYTDGARPLSTASFLHADISLRQQGAFIPYLVAKHFTVFIHMKHGNVWKRGSITSWVYMRTYLWEEVAAHLSLLPPLSPPNPFPLHFMAKATGAKYSSPLACLAPSGLVQSLSLPGSDSNTGLLRECGSMQGMCKASLLNWINC